MTEENKLLIAIGNIVLKNLRNGKLECRQEGFLKLLADVENKYLPKREEEKCSRCYVPMTNCECGKLRGRSG